MRIKAPLAKPRTSPCFRPAFYWRGGDALREREYIADEFRKALIAHRKAEADLAKVEAQIRTVAQTLSERDGYTAALAGYLDGDTDGFAEENLLKADLAQVERDLADAQQELKRKRAMQSPGVTCALQKEKAYYLIEIERQIKAIENCGEGIERSRIGLATVAISPRYQTGFDLEFKEHRVNEKRRYLRALVNRRKKALESRPPLEPLYSNETRTMRLAMQTGVGERLRYLRLRERQEQRPAKHRQELSLLIGQIEELNTRMTELGADDCELEDTEALRDELLRQDDQRDRAEPAADAPAARVAQADADATPETPAEEGEADADATAENPAEEAQADATPETPAEEGQADADASRETPPEEQGGDGEDVEKQGQADATPEIPTEEEGRADADPAPETHAEEERGDGEDAEEEEGGAVEPSDTRQIVDRIAEAIVSEPD
jgi:hypothetical protein